MKKKQADFGGWATVHGVKCGDGRIIDKNAFAHNDGNKVPILYRHDHDALESILGHGFLSHSEKGMYVEGFFNETENAQKMKEMVNHGDITHLSVFANRLVEEGSIVKHGEIREVSLVIAGKNPEARIETVGLAHGYDEDIDEAYIYTGENIDIYHSDDEDEEESIFENIGDEEAIDMVKAIVTEELDEEMVKKYESLNDDEKDAISLLVGDVLESSEKDDEEGDSEKDDNVEHDDLGGKEMGRKHIFDANKTVDGKALAHDEFSGMMKHAMDNNLESTKKYFKDTIMKHGIENMGLLYPDAKALTSEPEFISRRMDWVEGVMSGVSKSPFSKVKTLFADITADEARARGYITGNKKIEEVFKLLQRETTPTTIYKLQKLDRDSMIDIVDYNAVSLLKREMQTMLKEEVARAILVGDGRSISDESKVKEDNIRPIWKDDTDLFVINKVIDIPADISDLDYSDLIIDTVTDADDDYRGSGNKVFYAPSKVVNKMMKARDNLGRKMYRTLADLASELDVDTIKKVPVMAGLSRTFMDGETETTKNLLGIIVDLKDYNVGADRGGETTMFDDFDINYNKYTYLIEGRSSGALIRPFSAIVVEGVNTVG